MLEKPAPRAALPVDKQTFDSVEAFARFCDAFTRGVPHNVALGVKMVDLFDDGVTMRLPYHPQLVGNPETGVLHGGAVTSLLDATCGAAVFARLMKAIRIATLDLRIDYLRPATPPQDVLARATCYRLARQVAFVRAVAYHDDTERPIASAASTFMIFHGESSVVANSLDKE